MDSTTAIVIAVLVLVAIAIVAIVVAGSRRRSAHLQERFGPEYDRTLQATGSRSRAEADLAQRERQHKELQLRDLSPNQREEYAANWNAIQGRFVDDPQSALADADRLLHEVMAARGYPVGDFSQQAEELSVEYGDLVGDYRKAHVITVSSNNGNASTEDRRRAMVLYRSLFDKLLTPETAGTRRAS